MINDSWVILFLKGVIINVLFGIIYFYGRKLTATLIKPITCPKERKKENNNNKKNTVFPAVQPQNCSLS